MNCRYLLVWLVVEIKIPQRIAKASFDYTIKFIEKFQKVLPFDSGKALVESLKMLHEVRFQFKNLPYSLQSQLIFEFLKRAFFCIPNGN